MELSEAKRLIRGGESQTVEFKRKIKYPEKVIKELVAFANTDGGYLFVGVSDDGDLAGVKYPDEHIFSLNTAIEKYCRPKLPFEQETLRLTESESLVVYHIPSSERKPHYILNQPDKTKQFFVRSEDKSIKASRQVKEIIERRRKQKSVTFNFGDKEKWLMDYLDKNQSITLQAYKKHAKINTYQASRGLILMVLANVLEIIPSDKEDLYTLKN
ncbi:ATP-binding protein [Fulvivirga sp. RKSG066]|uniref:AlbA family DNA-binding domain-containing protein n=1 Tax=Fulvivirga aurantia TaxID=2529383 RepID=UPI0012BC33AA|nr:ATP-binding protein [Fulvivirga aurantia]MTI22371.1 ATP-binding protein [Fulvivirga aurantia]